MIPKNVESTDNKIIKVKNLKKNKIIQNKEKDNDNINNNYSFITSLDNSGYVKNNNIFENIRHNKYLIPMIEKKKTEKTIFKSKIKEAPNYISDFFAKIRKRPNSKSINYNTKDIYSINNKFNFDNINNDTINSNIYFKINNNYDRNSSKLINNISFNNYITYSKKAVYNPNLTENNNYKKSNILLKNILNQNNNFDNFYENEYSYNEQRYNTSLINDTQENEYSNNYKKERKIYPQLNIKDLDKYNKNIYLKRNNIYERKNKTNFKIDYDKYLQNRKLFFIYRAKLFKLLYKSLSIIFNKYFKALKSYSFQKIKKYKKPDKNFSKINKKNIINRIYLRRNENYFLDKLNTYNKSNKINKNYSDYSYLTNQIKNTIYENNIFNNSMISSKSCYNFIKNKNENESKEKRDNSELCRNRNYLIEKYKEIRKRKNIKKKEINNKDELKNKEQITNIYTHNHNLYVNLKNKLKIYKKKKLECNTERGNSSFINNKNNNKKINKPSKNMEKYNNNLNNKEEMKKIFIMERYNNLNKKNKKINNNNTKKKEKNKEKKLQKLNKYFIKKIIKSIKTSDKKLFVNINYVYLSNTEIKSKYSKYNENLLIIENTDNFSIINKKRKKNIIINKNRLIGIIEEESSNINYTNDSNNSIEYKIENKINRNSNNDKSNYLNDKYLFSCVNFIIKSIKKVLLKNTYIFFKKKLKIEN